MCRVTGARDGVVHIGPAPDSPPRTTLVTYWPFGTIVADIPARDRALVCAAGPIGSVSYILAVTGQDVDWPPPARAAGFLEMASDDPHISQGDREGIARCPPTDADLQELRLYWRLGALMAGPEWHQRLQQVRDELRDGAEVVPISVPWLRHWVGLAAADVDALAEAA
jgi:hypothetical protein